MNFLLVLIYEPNEFISRKYIQALYNTVRVRHDSNIILRQNVNTKQTFTRTFENMRWKAPYGSMFFTAQCRFSEWGRRMRKIVPRRNVLVKF